MKTLHLNLHKKWFDMILSGEKKEEYRKLTNHWLKRFTGDYITDEHDKTDDLSDSIVYSAIAQNSDIICESFFKFNTITFSNGMKSIDVLPRFEIEFKGAEVKEGNLNWGAEKGTKYFVLKLGEILNKQNC